MATQFTPDERARFDAEIARRKELIRQIIALLNNDMWKVDGAKLNELAVGVMGMHVEMLVGTIDAYVKANNARAASANVKTDMTSTVEEVGTGAAAAATPQ